MMYYMDGRWRRQTLVYFWQVVFSECGKAAFCEGKLYSENLV